MNKREARKEFKARKAPQGIFAVRCTASGEVWVSGSDHLNTAQNGVWFLLRNGLHHNKPLQAAWNTHGERAFEYAVLETLDEETAPLLLKDSLRERQTHWQRALGAGVV